MGDSLYKMFNDMVCYDERLFLIGTAFHQTMLLFQLLIAFLLK